VSSFGMVIGTTSLATVKTLSLCQGQAGPRREMAAVSSPRVLRDGPADSHLGPDTPIVPVIVLVAVSLVWSRA